MNRDKSIMEVKDFFGVTLQAVSTWTKKGCPHDLVPKGMKVVMKFNIDEVREWIIQQRK